MESAEAGKSILLIPEPKKCKLGNGYLPWNKAKFSCDKDGMPSGENLVCVCPDESLKEQQYNLSIGDFGISIFADKSADANRPAIKTSFFFIVFPSFILNLSAESPCMPAQRFAAPA